MPNTTNSVDPSSSQAPDTAQDPASSSPVLETFPLSSQWPTFDPFLFCAHHDDRYPHGNGELGPDASLAGHNIGQDFEHADGWNMYHGSAVPGFPQHPHRGFETVSYVRRGLMDHADSLGATARLGDGDVQWMTAGSGVQHSEMFPLLRTDAPNPLELFQIWLNLPAKDKMVQPYFTMIWDEDMPRLTSVDEAGHKTEVVVLAGKLPETTATTPPANSWAAQTESDIGIWHVKLDANASWTLPKASSGTTRALYLFQGESINLDGTSIAANTGARIAQSTELTVTAGASKTEFMILQGRPIGEPVAKYGPFVMNTEAEIHAAFSDYRQTQFGGWPWSSASPDHGPTRGRFATHVDGRTELPPVPASSDEALG